MGYRPWDRRELDTIGRLTFIFTSTYIVHQYTSIFKREKQVGTKDSVKWEDKNVTVSWLWDKSLILQNTRLKWGFFLLNPSLPSWKGHWLPWIYQISWKRWLVLSAYTVWRNRLQLNVDTSLVIASYETGKESNYTTCFKYKETFRVRDFPGGPVVKMLPFHCRDTDLIPGQGTKILHTAWHVQNFFWIKK